MIKGVLNIVRWLAIVYLCGDLAFSIRAEMDVPESTSASWIMSHVSFSNKSLENSILHLSCGRTDGIVL